MWDIYQDRFSIQMSGTWHDRLVHQTLLNGRMGSRLIYLQWVNEYNSILEKNPGWCSGSGSRHLSRLRKIISSSPRLLGPLLTSFGFCNFSLQPFLSILWTWITPSSEKYLIQTRYDLLCCGLATLLTPSCCTFKKKNWELPQMVILKFLIP